MSEVLWMRGDSEISPVGGLFFGGLFHEAAVVETRSDYVAAERRQTSSGPSTNVIPIVYSFFSCLVI